MVYDDDIGLVSSMLFHHYTLTYANEVVTYANEHIV